MQKSQIDLESILRKATQKPAPPRFSPLYREASQAEPVKFETFEADRQPCCC